MWEGENIRFGTDSDIGAVCNGSLRYADEVVGYLAAKFDVGQRSGPLLDIYWSPEDIGDYCTEGALGCARTERNEVYTQFIIHQHEFVHALRADGLAFPPLEEGFAELYGDDWAPFSGVTGDVTTLFETHDGAMNLDSGGWYPLAEHFVSFLRARSGEEALFDLMDRSGRETPWSEVRAEFEDVYGVSFESLVAEHSASYPACEHPYARDNGFDCGRDAQAMPDAVGAEVRIDVELGCGHPEVLGPRRGERWVTRALDFTSGGHYRFGADRVGGLEPGRVRFSRCGQTCFDLLDEDRLDLEFDLPKLPDGVMPQDYALDLCVPSGRHLVRLAINDDDEGGFQLRFARGDGSACGG